MHATRSLRQLALVLVVFVLAACGGSDQSSDPNNVAPTASIRIAASVPVTAVVQLDGSGSGAAGGRTLTFSWVLTSKPAGSTATIVNPTTSQPTLTPDVVGTYAVTLTVNDGNSSNVVSGSLTATAYTPPTIISDLVQPVSGTVQLGLSTDPGASLVTWSADGTTINTGTTVAWDTTTVANGSHVVLAHLLFAGNYTLDVSTTFQVAQSAVSFTGPIFSEGNGLIYAIVGASSVNGIVRVDATLDGVFLGTLAVRNGCLDLTGAACTTSGFNGYAFGGSVGSGAHVVVITATDGIGNTLGIQLRRTVTDVP